VKKIQKNKKNKKFLSFVSSSPPHFISKMPPGRPPLTKIINALQKKKATMISKKKTNVKTKTKKKPLKMKEEDFFFNSSGGMMMTEEEEEEENNRILAHGNEEEEKNYETNGMNLKEILTQRLEGRVGGPTRRSAKGGWTPAEDDVLRRAVAIYKGKNWKKIGKKRLLSSLSALCFDIISSLKERIEKSAERKIFEFEFFWFFFWTRFFFARSYFCLSLSLSLLLKY